MSNERAILFSCAGENLTAAERAFFREVEPLGFILFQRNCRDQEQVHALIDDATVSGDGGHPVSGVLTGVIAGAGGASPGSGFNTGSTKGVIVQALSGESPR